MEAQQQDDHDSSCSTIKKKKFNELFLIFLLRFKQRLLNLKIGDQLVIPGGWIAPKGGHAIMHVITYDDINSYSFTICNMGAGINYHPATIKDYPKDKFRTSICIKSIPTQRFLDDAFWYLFWRAQCIADDNYNDELYLYEVLYPYLANGQSVASVSYNTSSIATDYYRTPQRAGNCYFKSILELTRYLIQSTPNALSHDHAKQLAFITRLEVFQMMYEDLQLVNHQLQDESDLGLINMACIQVANAALKEYKRKRFNVLKLNQLMKQIQQITTCTSYQYKIKKIQLYLIKFINKSQSK